MDMESAKTLMKGATAPLVSSFKLTYYTLLNMMKRSAGGASIDICAQACASLCACGCALKTLSVMRVHACAAEMDMERVIGKSFHQFQHDKALPEARTPTHPLRTRTLARLHTRLFVLCF
jgi:superfamily II RNA helicase